MELTEYTNVKKVVELLDAAIVEDMMESRFDPRAILPCYCVGFEAEPAAGFRQVVVTPFFDSMGELDQFCEKYIQKFQLMAAQNRTWYVNDEGEDVDFDTPESK